MLTIPREICRDLEQVLTREWIVTNGLGGFASSSLAGANTRRYHGLLVAALKPPAARTVTLSKIDEELEVGGTTYRLGTNEYESGTVHPDGYLFLERVEFDGTLPTFVYHAASFTLKKTVWMEYGRNTTYIRYTLGHCTEESARLTLLPLCTFRDFHTEMRGANDARFDVTARVDEIEIIAQSGATPYCLLTLPTVNFVPLDLWYWRFRHRVEHERGLDSVEDLYLPGLWRVQLRPGQSFTVVATTEAIDTIERDVPAALEREQARQVNLTTTARDEFEKRLYLAADQFIVQRTVDDEKKNTVIAGYPWFSDWGRDTMIALEGLTLATGRAHDAKNILRAFARYVDQGMLPNRFPDAGIDAEPIEYNTVDATLWYLHAIDRYMTATNDHALLRDLFPILESIIDWHVKGTRYGIRVDPIDGLLYAGERGVQLTWMDAKVGTWVVTPRIGKPVEINALWYRGLRLMERWAAQLGKSPTRYADLASEVRVSFERFWYAGGNYFYDVIDSPKGNDAALRPNQLFALVDDLVPLDRARSALEIITRSLLTPLGLRTLAPQDPNYRAMFRGDQTARDAAYHQGIVWAWLIGAYADAFMRVSPNANAETLRTLLEPFAAHLTQAGIGTISEVFEAEPPYRAVGCFAQAWSVAEVLRVLKRANRF